MTPKIAGADCPKCGEKPAGYKLASENFYRWTCNGCGASGRIGFEQPASTQEKKPTVHKHWSARRA